jgi:hypothetical protein
MRLNCKFNNPKTTGHYSNIIETKIYLEGKYILLTYYEDQQLGTCGSEVYFHTNNLYSHHYKSFNYTNLIKLPKKYLPYVNELKRQHRDYYHPPK